MIDKKPPKFTAKDDLGDGFDDEEETVTPHPVDDMSDEGDELEGADDGEVAAVAMVAAQKRNGLIITYGIGGLFFVGAAFLMWPHFKHYFTSPAPVQTAVYTRVPDQARKNYFASGTPAFNDTTDKGTGGSTDTATTLGTHAQEPSPGDTGTGIPSTVPAPPLGTPAPTAILPSVAASTGQAPAEASSASGLVLPSVSPVAPPAPSAPPPQAAAPATDEPDTKIAALQGTMDKLQSTTDKLGATQDATDAQLKQIQATLTALQAEVTQVSAKQTAAPRPKAREGSHARSWELRSAVPGLALISHPGSNDLQRVSEGDLVSGLGKITSISEKDGHWVVQGTDGSVAGE